MEFSDSCVKRVHIVMTNPVSRSYLPAMLSQQAGLPSKARRVGRPACQADLSGRQAWGVGSAATALPALQTEWGAWSAGR